MHALQCLVESFIQPIITSLYIYAGPLEDSRYIHLIKNSQAVKKGAAPKKAMVKKDVKSKVVAKKWL